MPQRQEILTALLKAETPEDIARLTEALSRYSLDYAGVPAVEIGRTHIRSILTAYLSGTLSTADVAKWAWALEGREDTALEASEDAENPLFFILAELANPETEGALTPDRARKMIAALSAAAGE